MQVNLNLVRKSQRSVGQLGSLMQRKDITELLSIFDARR